MRFNDILRLSFKNISKRKTRTLLTIIGIVIGIFSMVALISIGKGMQNYVEDTILTLGSNKITILPMKQFGIPPSKFFDDKQINSLKNIRGIETIVYGWYGGANLKFKDESKFVRVFSSNPKATKKLFLDISGYSLAKGRLLNDKDKHKVTLGYSVANEMFDKKIKINDKVIINGISFKVVGIFNEIGSDDDKSVGMTLKDGENIFHRKNAYNFMFVGIKKNADINYIVEQINKKLEKIRGSDDFSVMTAQELAQKVNVILSVLTFFLIGVAAISLLVGSIGIANTMHMSILERRKEIGIFKALGAEIKDIILMFIIESGLLGFFGGLIGVFLGLITSKLTEIIASKMGFPMLKAWIDIKFIIFVLLFSFILGIISGYFPARSGSKLDPIETLRNE